MYTSPSVRHAYCQRPSAIAGAEQATGAARRRPRRPRDALCDSAPVAQISVGTTLRSVTSWPSRAAAASFRRHFCREIADAGGAYENEPNNNKA